MSKTLGVAGVVWVLGALGCHPPTSGTIAGLVTDSGGAPLSGVQVKSGTATATTASDGSYDLALPAAASVVLSFSKASYLDTANAVPALAGDTTTLDVTLFAAAAPENLDATAGGTVTGARGSSLTAGPGSFVTLSGAAVSGQVQVALTPLDPTKPAELAAYPGQLLGTINGGPPELLRTFGVLDVTVTQNGQRLQIAHGKTITVTIPAAASDALPATEDLWSFNMTTAVWIHEGMAQKNGSVYTAQLPHLSFWNLDSPDQINDASCIQGKVKDATGKGVVGAQVKAIGLSVSGESNLAFTDGSGHYCTWVPAYSTVEVDATARLHGKKAEGSIDAMSAAVQPYMPICESAGQCLTVPDIVLGKDELDGGTSSGLMCGGAMGGMDGGTGSGSTDGGLTLSATCAAPLINFFNCFDAAGMCSLVTEMGGYEVDFANGAKAKWTTSGSSVMGQLYGPKGTLCGSETANSDGTLDILPSGTTGAFVLTKTSIDCPDGMMITLAPAQSSAIGGCVGSASGGSCTTMGSP